MLPFIVIGLTSGAVYALAGLGLVLTYKTSGVFNFAYGALSAVAAYVFYALYVQSGWPWPLGAAVAILIVGPLMGLALELLARRIQGATLTLQVASTVGLLLVIDATVQLIYGTQTVRTVPVFLGTTNVRLAGTNVQVSQIVTFLFALVVSAALTLLLRFSRSGIAMRAVVDDPDLLGIAGTSPRATRRMAWMIGVTLAAASGVLFAPLLPLDPIQLTLLVASAFGAAAIGAFTSLPLTLAGGLGIGVLASLCTKWFQSGLLSGLPASLPFVVLLVVVLVFPKRFRARRELTTPQARPTWRAPLSLRLTGGAVLLASLLCVPTFAGIHLTNWTTFVATSIVFMALALLVRTSGQVSLAHVAFMAIGATAFSHLTLGSGVPWLIALVLAGLIAVPIGALIAIPAIRLSGLYLALATFGFGIVLQDVFYSEGYMFGPTGIGVNDPRPSVSWLSIGSDRGFYYVTLVIAGLAAVLVVALTRGRLGRLLRGAAEAPVPLQCSGASVTVTRLLVFCVSAFLTAVGGALAGVSQGTVIGDSYQPVLSLTYFATIVIVAGSAPWDAILAAAGLILVPSYVSGEQVSTVLQLLFGTGAIGYALLGGSPGTPASVQGMVDRVFGRRRALMQAGRPRSPAAISVPPSGAPGSDRLTVERVTVRFDGILAVADVSLTAETGRIVGLIGPNGAGKTTILNVCSGLLRSGNGRVLLGERDLSRRPPSVRAILGLGRTFQRIELFDSLSVQQNVELGAEAAVAGSNPLTHMWSRRRDASSIRAAAETALDLCGLEALGDQPAISLSTGQRRLVELARCFAGPFELLLLDEPCSGLDEADTRRLADVLRRVVAERGVGILLVEHNMSLVLDVCDHVYVLDFGELIMHGAPAEVARSELVRAAYLGSGEIENMVGTDDPVEEVS